MEAGLTLEQLAYTSEMGSKGYLSDIERGLAMPSIFTLQSLAERLNVQLFDLLVAPGTDARSALTDKLRHMSDDRLQQVARSLKD